jgi:2-phospho-L-lactate guanylyltransferase
VHILIPCKNLDVGKSRLSECLNSRARREFCEQLLTRTLEQAAAVVAPARILVVTSDLEAATIARRCSVAQVPDPGDGLNAALEDARAALLAKMAYESAILILPIDLPFASPDAISKVLSCAGDIVIAPDESGTGTNVLLLRSPALRNFRFSYGPGSYAAHVAAARARGLTIETLKDWRLAFDVDGPAQYVTWRSWQEREHDGYRTEN